MDHLDFGSFGWFSRAFAFVLLPLQASCALVGYDAIVVSLDAGGRPTAPQVEAPAEDAGAPDPTQLDAGAVDLPLPPDVPEAPEAQVPLPGPSIPVADQDAGEDVEPPSDAAVPGNAGPMAPCSGAPALGVCWYLASPAASCESTCAGHGGWNPRAASLIGTTSQGGRLSNCRRVLFALGVMQPPQRAQREDNLGLGCHIWSNGETFWLDDPSPRYSPRSPGVYTARVSCGCMR